jgi:hypothetical protein
MPSSETNNDLTRLSRAPERDETDSVGQFNKPTITEHMISFIMMRAASFHSYHNLRLTELSANLNNVLSVARIGQFLLATGTLAVLDLGILKGLWDSPGVQSIIAAEMVEGPTEQLPNRHERRAEAKRHTERADRQKVKTVVNRAGFVGGSNS